MRTLSHAKNKESLGPLVDHILRVLARHVPLCQWLVAKYAEAWFSAVYSLFVSLFVVVVIIIVVVVVVVVVALLLLPPIRSQLHHVADP
jgi:hypothetical protein